MTRTLGEFIQDAEGSKKIKMLLYGAPGSGKTFAALTAPRPIYFILVGSEDELLTALGKDFRDKYPDFDPDADLFYDVVSDELGKRGQFVHAVGLDEAGDRIDEALKRDADPSDPFHFETLVVDNISRLSEAAMTKSVEFGHSQAKEKGKTSLARFEKHGILVPSDRDWGGQMSLVKQFVGWLCSDIPKHVIVIAHEWIKTSTDRISRVETTLSIKPLVTGNLREQLPNMFSCYWRMDKKGQIYRALTQGDGTFEAKTRLGGNVGVTERDPNLSVLFDRMLSPGR